MIARTWSAQTPLAQADGFYQHLLETGVADYKQNKGCREVLLLRRDEGEWSSFLLISVWDSLNSIRKYTGDDIEKAVLYEDDEKFELIPDDEVFHYQILVVG